MKTLKEQVREKVLVYDGAKGVMLQRRGLKGGETSEYWNIIKPDVVKEVYALYKEAGSDVLQANTFPGNRAYLEKYQLGDKTYDINYMGVKLAKEVAGDSHFVAASVGATGEIFEPAGELTFETAYDVYKEQVNAIEAAGADCVNFETFSDIAEMRAAILAAKENTRQMIVASFSFEKNGRTLSGNSPEVCAIVSQALGAELVGASCSEGPAQLSGVIEKMYRVAKVPLVVKPNAGLPKVSEGKVIYEGSPEEFGTYTKTFLENGVRLIGGCCGSTPEYVCEIKKEVEQYKVGAFIPKEGITIASPYNYLVMDSGDYEIGLIDQNGLDLEKLLSTGDYQGIVDYALDLTGEGAQIIMLDFVQVKKGFDVKEFIVNMSLFIKQPVILKTEDKSLLEQFLRFYPGQAGVAAIFNGDGEMVSVVKHYGATLIKEEYIERNIIK